MTIGEPLAPATTGPNNLCRELPEGIVRLETTVLQHPSHLAAKAMIGGLHRRARSRALGIHREIPSSATLVLGNARVGKSWALEDYMGDYPSLSWRDGVPTGALPPGVDHSLQDADYRPVVTASVPSNVDLRSFVSAILMAFGYVTRDYWDSAKIIQMIDYYAREFKTDIVFIDEGHNLLNSCDVNDAMDLLGFLKELINRVGCHFVIAGLPILEKLFTIDAQILGRTSGSITIRPYLWGTKNETILFIKLLKQFERLIGLPRSSGFETHDIARRIYIASYGGRIGLIRRLLSEAGQRAIDAGEECISKERLAEAYQLLSLRSSDDDVEGTPNFLDEQSMLEDAASAGASSNPLDCAATELPRIWQELMGRVERERKELEKLLQPRSRRTRLRPDYS
ncbi:TniB family NTP-binding protein [Sphingomonas xinjiangensis]|uniref:TniB protein n=1 Tax=Sphingomonas xinjiangensis TaxID=643568 RepID=A0A840YH15_9SPHN|nr:TniB family NTP-binding protein [Sphingomonas xinjiangensis]MBB5711289.1 hypothetical protein [Sphingomonas xinjiangensis]